MAPAVDYKSENIQLKRQLQIKEAEILELRSQLREQAKLIAVSQSVPIRAPSDQVGFNQFNSDSLKSQIAELQALLKANEVQKEASKAEVGMLVDAMMLVRSRLDDAEKRVPEVEL